MEHELLPGHAAAWREFRDYGRKQLAPGSEERDRLQQCSPELIRGLADKGYLGALVPTTYGGAGLDMVAVGLLHEAVGGVCSSMRSLLTVHSMVCEALLRWGTKAQRSNWLPGLACGRDIAAFALTEPNVGSDAAAIEANAVAVEDGYFLSGCKRWITFGQIASVFLTFAQGPDGPTAFLVPRQTPGLTVSPVSDLLGLRASLVGNLTFDRCRIPAANMLGKPGYGIRAVAAAALDLGRYSVAWGCTGIIRGCLEASVEHAGRRIQGGKLLKDHQLIKRLLSGMYTAYAAAFLLCLSSGRLREAGDPAGLTQICVAKYYAAQSAAQVAADAVQIHGASGCAGGAAVQRHYRDAKLMELIEGSTQIQELLIADIGGALLPL